MLSQTRIIFAVLALILFSFVLMKYAMHFYQHSLSLRNDAMRNHFNSHTDFRKWKLANSLFRASQIFGLIAIIQILVAIAISVQLFI